MFEDEFTVAQCEAENMASDSDSEELRQFFGVDESDTDPFPIAKIEEPVAPSTKPAPIVGSSDQAQDKMPNCMRQYMKSDLSTRTFQYFFSATPVQFIEGSQDVFACEGMSYKTRHSREWTYIARMMEVSIKTKVWILFHYY